RRVCAVADPTVVGSCREDAAETGASIEVVVDPAEAVAGARVLYTDVWTSMGQEDEHERRLRAPHPDRIDTGKLAAAAPDAIALHCLPAHVGEEITADVLYGDRALVWDQAETRLHVYKAVLALTVRGNSTTSSERHWTACRPTSRQASGMSPS